MHKIKRPKFHNKWGGAPNTPPINKDQLAAMDSGRHWVLSWGLRVHWYTAHDPAMSLHECMYASTDSTNWTYKVIKNKVRGHKVGIGTY